MLELAREVAVLARNHGRRREARSDLLRHVRAGEHRDRAAAYACGEALARRRVESLREAEHRRVPRQRLDDVAERRARDCHDDDVDIRGSVRKRDRLGGSEVDVLEVARVPAVLGDRLRLLGGAAREHDLVLAIEQEARERRPPRTGTDNEKPHHGKLSRKASLWDDAGLAELFFVAWMVGLAGAGVASVLVPSDNPQVARAGRVWFALVLLADLLLPTVFFMLEKRDGSGSLSGSRSFWWLMALACGIPLALVSGFAVRRGYVGHRLALTSSILATCVLYLAFPLGFESGSGELTGLGRFEHTHRPFDIAILLIPTLILLVSEVLRGRDAPDPEQASLFSQLRNASRRTTAGVVLGLAALVWLAGASGAALAVTIAVLLVGGGLFVWWSNRTTVRRVRRNLQ